MWADFHNYWLEKRAIVPTYFVRYEDLLEDPGNTLADMSKFIVGATTLDEYPGITSMIDEITTSSQ